MKGVRGLVEEINSGLKQRSASGKDEELVMRALLNDKEYKVDVYGKNGIEGTYCPAEEARDMISTVIASTTKISQEEARTLADAHTFKKSESNAFVGISKEFVNTYLDTGRKLPLGGRATSDVALTRRHNPESIATYPKKAGVDAQGKDIYTQGQTKVPAHDTIKVHGSSPDWL